MSEIRVLLADDHPLWRRGVSGLLAFESDINVLAEASDGKEALHLLRSTAFDVAVLYMEMPGATGVEVARAVHAEGIKVNVLALSSYDDPEYVSGLLASGAAGYLTKSQPPEMVVEAVRAVARGERRWFVSPTTKSATDTIRGTLSGRQREVLRLLALGQSNTQIAEALFVSENTVRNHLTGLYARLGVVSAREAVAWAWRTGFAQDEG
jgi:DNA-binding NarL/FixJ family response regulator